VHSAFSGFWEQNKRQGEDRFLHGVLRILSGIKQGIKIVRLT
jgi:hypothetical protein